MLLHCLVTVVQAQLKLVYQRVGQSKIWPPKVSIAFTEKNNIENCIRRFTENIYKF